MSVAVPGEACGLACDKSVAQDAGHPVSDQALQQFSIDHGDNPSDGTGGLVHVQFLNSIGIRASQYWGDEASMVRAGEADGLNRWYLCIWSNGWGDPYTGPNCVGHWVLTDGVLVMNPIGGRILGGSYLQACFNAQQRYAVQVDQPIGTSPIIDTTEDLLLMADIGLSADDRQRWFCRSRWHRYEDRAVPDEGTMQGLLTLLRTKGADGVEEFLSDSPEGASRENQLRHLLDSQAV